MRSALRKRDSKAMKLTEDAGATPELEQKVEDTNSADDRPFDPIAFDAAMKKWRGFLGEQMLADGFTTTEALMDDIRGPVDLVLHARWQ